MIPSLLMDAPYQAQLQALDRLARDVVPAFGGTAIRWLGASRDAAHGHLYAVDGVVAHTLEVPDRLERLHIPFGVGGP